MSSRQRKAPFLPRYLHHSRERYCLSCRYSSSPDFGEGLGGGRGVVRVRRFVGQKPPPPTARSTPFLCSCAKKRGGAPKKRAFGCRHGGCWVPPASPTDSKPQHHRRLRQADFAWPINQPASNQLDAPIRPVGAYARMGEAGGPTKVMWRRQKRFSLAARHRFFGQAPKKWGRIAGQAIDHLLTYRRTRTSVKKEGGTPGEGSPLDSTAFEKAGETFIRASRREGRQNSLWR